MAYSGGYDSKCHDLAYDFLSEDACGNAVQPAESVVAKLAQTIQDTIEDFLGDLESDRQQELEAARDAAAEQKMDERRGPDRDEWRHEAAERQRLK